jgi:LPXTG-site transpeptidase (sortase) family protein
VETSIPSYPVGAPYHSLGDLWLEIPAQNVRAAITGVPLKSQGWDLTWLRNQIGWLEGTAAPTWTGNTVLTAHAYTADGAPGPFVALKNLKYGDSVVIHSGGYVYTYQVKTKALVSANNTSLLTKHEDQDWVSLVTCQTYDEATASYKYRVVVRAILVTVEEE